MWKSNFDPQYAVDGWAKNDCRLSPSVFSATAEWNYNTPLRSHYARRQALVEIDVLMSLGLGLSLKQLQTMYRAQFYVMRSYEQDTWYDRQGSIVFTNSKGLVGVGLKRKQAKGDATPGWEDVKDMKSGTVERTVADNTLPGGPHERTIVYEAPFDHCDREQDYEVAWKHFCERFGDKA
jgi:hypothetical protein